MIISLRETSRYTLFPGMERRSGEILVSDADANANTERKAGVYDILLVSGAVAPHLRHLSKEHSTSSDVNDGALLALMGDYGKYARSDQRAAQGILYLSEVAILPGMQGRRLGLRAAARLIEAYAQNVGLVLALPVPTGSAHTMNYTSSPGNDWRVEAEQSMALARLWGRLGLKPSPGGPPARMRNEGWSHYIERPAAWFFEVGARGQTRLARLIKKFDEGK